MHTKIEHWSRARLAACPVHVTIFSTGRKSHPVSIPSWLHALTLVTHSYVLLVLLYSEKHLRGKISRFCSYSQKFSPRNLGCGILWRHKPAIGQSFFRENLYFPPICRSFLLQKFPAIQYKFCCKHISYFRSKNYQS